MWLCSPPKSPSGALSSFEQAAVARSVVGSPGLRRMQLRRRARPRPGQKFRRPCLEVLRLPVFAAALLSALLRSHGDGDTAPQFPHGRAESVARAGDHGRLERCAPRPPPRPRASPLASPLHDGRAAAGSHALRAPRLFPYTSLAHSAPPSNRRLLAVPEQLHGTRKLPRRPVRVPTGVHVLRLLAPHVRRRLLRQRHVLQRHVPLQGRILRRRLLRQVLPERLLGPRRVRAVGRQGRLPLRAGL